MKYCKIFLAALALLALLAGCSDEAQEVDAREGALVQPESADLEGAMEAIYGENTVRGVGPADDEEMEDILGFDLSMIEEYSVMYSKENYGVQDTYILRPVSGRESDVREALQRRQDDMIARYDGYDVYGAYEISQNGVIFEQGEYLVMLMHEDNDAVRAVIDQYIPSR